MNRVSRNDVSERSWQAAFREVREETGEVAAVVELLAKDGGWLQGAADARRFGRASGY